MVLRRNKGQGAEQCREYAFVYDREDIQNQKYREERDKENSF